MKTIKNNELVELGLNDLRYPNQFMVDQVTDLIRRKNCDVESGMLFKYRITKFKQEKATDELNYIGYCDLEMQIGNNPVRTIKKVSMSSLLVYMVSTSPKKYLNVEFTSFNTTLEYTCNPLCLVKMKDGKFVLFNVSENGKEFFKVSVPGVEDVVCFRYKAKKRENYIRYHVAKQD